ncbi:putative domain HDIG-containing protein [Desulfitobacterium dichloroeliminans LMG P-21439]|uniref:Putative domain HDIG-containing protein n=1 Tax=Desulfitobacterium dichloroeliminans (strain LMG P-21439 / DCA1) TaxID=871963 RepID=L0FAD4_DESDL|nr:HDIG domain-containing metalloprotein [Desulfitobacterium dichloroeliminans]AGA69606.1 putative domain HDIG-containing protein [Desulfitobacterium dichloroeliminans LMG P-21439]
MLYRVRQFYNTIYPKINTEELEWALKLLPPCSVPLFKSQPLPEQRHALDVALDLCASGIHNSHLLAAALLHDCGKAKHPLKVWERVAIVLLQKLPRQIWDHLLSCHSPLSLSLRTAQEHPSWGAEMAQEFGLDLHIIELIREHHDPRSKEGRLLYEADNRH